MGFLRRYAGCFNFVATAHDYLQADARRESLQRSADYQKYIENLKGTAYFRGEVEGSALWKELEDKAGEAFVAARRDE